MKKKIYVKLEMKVIQLQSKTQLLAGSDRTLDTHSDTEVENEYEIL